MQGIVPPGRRLGDDSRPSRWSASGVRGVVPPGKLDPRESPTVQWAKRLEAKKAAKVKANRAAARRAEPVEAPEIDWMRPMAGFIPALFADAGDPDDLEAMLEELSAFISEHRPSIPLAESFRELLTQSSAPYELVVGFTVLSAIIGRSTQLRRRYALALERGAKAFFNLARRLNPTVKPPRGLAPETLDPIFFDLPDIALDVPFAYATDAFCRQIELLREDELPRDRALVEHASHLRRRFIERRAFGDRPLRDLFPWEAPEWLS